MWVSLLAALTGVIVFGAAPASGATAVNDVKTTSWSGYQVVAKNPGLLAYDYFKAPQVDCRATPNAFFYVWAGLGGGISSNPNLAQAGIRMSCTAGKYSGKLFWESIAGSRGDANLPHIDEASAVNPGDDISIEVCASDASVDGCYFPVDPGAHINKMYMRVTQYAARDGAQRDWIGTDNVTNNTNSAECIVERDDRLPQTDLAKFSPITQSCGIFQKSAGVNLQTVQPGYSVNRLTLYKQLRLGFVNPYLWPIDRVGAAQYLPAQKGVRERSSNKFSTDFLASH